MKKIEKAREAAQNGNFDIAKRLYNEILKGAEDDGDIYLEFAIYLYKNRVFEEALSYLVKAYEIGIDKRAVYEFIVDSYYLPSIGEFYDMYQKNISVLEKYEYFYEKKFLKFEELPINFLPFDEESFIEFYKISENFGKKLILKDEFDEERSEEINKIEEVEFGNILILKDEFNTNKIRRYEERINENLKSNSKRKTLYLYYSDLNTFYSYLQILDFTFVREFKNIIFLFGKKDLEKWFLYYQNVCLVPKFLFNTVSQELNYNSIDKSRMDINIKTYENINYYKNIDSENIIQRLEMQKPRILFVYNTDKNLYVDSAKELKKICSILNIPHELIVNGNTKLENELLITDVIYDFKPDIIFLINQTRYDYEVLKGLDNLVCVTWIQEILPNILNREAPLKFGKNDIVMNLFMTMKEFEDFGFRKDRIFDGYIPVNNYVYKDYELEDWEIEKYSADICSISDKSDPSVGLARVLSIFSDNLKFDSIKNVVKDVYDEIYERIYLGEHIHDISEQMKILNKEFSKRSIAIDENLFFDLSYWFKVEVVWRMKKSIPIEWLKEKGYKIKLWGNEWENHYNLKKYYHGNITNTEVLSKILNASKICLGTNPYITAHPRAYEAILSNCFYIGMNIPKKNDWANIRRYLREDIDFVMAYNKNDLFRKIDYYLKDNERREDMILNGKTNIMENLTYEVLIRNLFKRVKGLYS